MTQINTTPPQFSISVGSLDITDLVVSYSLRQSAIDIRRPIVWQGAITIAYVYKWASVCTFNPPTDVITSAGHGFDVGAALRFRTTGTMPLPLVAGTLYYVVERTTDTFKVSATPSGSPIDLTTVGTGTISAYESLDDFENPTRWARGKHPVTLSIGGVVVATLRISAYQYNEDDQTAEIQVSQLLELLDYKTPPEDYRFISTNNNLISVSAVVLRLLNAASLTSIDLTNAPQTFIPAPDRTNRSYIELAQELLGERRCWLYHQPNEAIAVVQFDKAQTKAFERSRPELIEFNRVRQRSNLSNVYRITGGGELYQQRCGLASSINTTEEIYGTAIRESGYWYRGERVVVTRRIFRKVVERIVTEVTKETADVVQITRTSYKDLKLKSATGTDHEYSLKKIAEEVDIKFYDSQGRLIRETRRKDGIAYLQYPGTKYDLYPDALEWLTGLEEVEVNYYSDPTDSEYYSGYSSASGFDTNVLRLKERIVSKRYLHIRRFVVEGTTQNIRYQFFFADKERVIETWIEDCTGQSEPTYTYSRKVYKRDPIYEYVKFVPSLIRSMELFLDNTLSDSQGDASPPSWATRAALYPRTRAKLNAEVRRRYPGADDDLIDKREFEYGARSITTAAEAQQLAGMFADLAVGRAFGYEAVLSLRESTEWIADPTPLQVAWLHNRQMLLDSVSLVFDGSEAELSWEAVTVGTLSPAVGEGTPTAQGLSTPQNIATLDFDVRFQAIARPFNATSPPDLSLITVDSNGDVVTSGGFVQASENQNQFAQILVAQDGTIVVNTEGNVVTTASDVYDPNIWDAIATVDGEVVTVDGEVVTV